MLVSDSDTNFIQQRKAAVHAINKNTWLTFFTSIYSTTPLFGTEIVTAYILFCHTKKAVNSNFTPKARVSDQRFYST